ncbi:hypothetical protein HY992_05355 [Candidatus Micrarchaeota archaeon]|nr:hypothetical protein [Candidatus Micrarchaeota archaeon]
MNAGKLFFWLMALFIVMGIAELFFLWPTERSPVFYFGNTVMHVPLLVGWLYLAFKRAPECRMHWFWTPYGLLIIFWVLATVYFADITEKGWGAVFQVSETFWYALAYGLLFAFYKLKSAKLLWYSMLFIAIFWNLQLIDLALQVAGVSPMLKGPPTLASYFQSGKFWNDYGWFISDMIVDIPMAIVSLYFITAKIRDSLTRRKQRER